MGSSTSLQRSQTSLPARPTTSPTQQSGGILSGIGGTIAQGMAFGTGSAIAHRAVGAVANSFSGSTEQPVNVQDMKPLEQNTATIPDVCSQDKQMYFDCLKQNSGDQNSCSFLYDMLKSCQSGTALTNFH